MERQATVSRKRRIEILISPGLGLNSNVGISMVLRWQDTQRHRSRDAVQGDEMTWLGRCDGSAAIDLHLIDTFPEGVEALGGWAEPWPWHIRW